MKVKVCGMKFKENIAQIAALQPDYLGFIFYKNSKRFYTEERIDLLENIQKVGVFVKAEIDEIINFSNQYK